MDRFTIHRTIGSGGMGVVYEAHDGERNTTVALKALRDVDAARLYRFKREFRALADLVHPNLVTLYEFVSIGDECFFTMELVEGVTFLEHVRPGFCRDDDGQGGGAGDAARSETADLGPAVDSEGRTRTLEPQRRGDWDRVSYRQRLLDAPLDETRLRAALAQLVAGVFALHQAGKLHRDIKPSNVLVRNDGRVVLCDFGLATEIRREQSDATREYEVVGTVAYMSPEQAANIRLTEASDWYSVGVVLYEALTGHRPFDGDQRTVLRDKQLYEAPGPGEFARGLPSDLESLCADLLRLKPEERPSGPAILRRLGVEPPPTQLPSPSSSTHETLLVGRESHLQRLDAAFAAVRQGRTTLALVHGSSGMGKTVLVRRFLEQVQGDDVVVLAGRCYERESVPYKALDTVVDALSAFLVRLPRREVDQLLPDDVHALARLFPVLKRVEAVVESPRRLDAPDPHETRRRAFTALRELFRRLATRYVVIVSIDDMQWGDADSAGLLTELLRPPRSPSLLLIGCYRSEDVDSSPLLRSLLDSTRSGRFDADVHELAVDALSPDDSRALVLALLQRGDTYAPDLAARIAAEAGGSPFFVDELARHADLVGAAGAPISLDDALLARVATLPAAARSLLTTICVAGGSVTQEVVGLAAGIGGEERQAMARLRAERLVRARGIRAEDPVEAFHDRIREAVVASLSADQLRDYHHRLALGLERAQMADPEPLMEHWRGAGDPARAGVYAASAAEQAFETLAFEHAAHLYRLALEMQLLSPDEARPLRARLADSLANAGRGADAAAVYLEAADGASAADALDYRRRAAEELLRSGYIDEGMVAAQAVADRVGMKIPTKPRQSLLSLLLVRARIRLRGLRFRERDASQVSAEELRRVEVCSSVAVGLGMVSNIFGATLQSRGLLLALGVGEPHRLSCAVAQEAVYTATAGGRGEKRVAKLLALSEKLAQKTGDQRASGMAQGAYAMTAYQVARFRSALEHAEQSAAIFREHCADINVELNTMRLLSLWCLYLLGELREFTHRIPALLSEAEGLGDRFAVANLCTGIPNIAWLISNDVAGARHVRRAAMKDWPSKYGYHLQHYWDLLARLQTGLYTGQDLAAWQELNQGWPALSRSMLLRIGMVGVEAHYTRARLAIAVARAGHEPARCLRRARRDARRIEGYKLRCSRPLALLLRAGAVAVEGRVEEAVDLLASAEQDFRAAEMALHATVCVRRRGALVGGDEGHDLAAAAEAWMEEQEVVNPERLTAMLAPGFGD